VEAAAVRRLAAARQAPAHRLPVGQVAGEPLPADRIAVITEAPAGETSIEGTPVEGTAPGETAPEDGAEELDAAEETAAAAESRDQRPRRRRRLGLRLSRTAVLCLLTAATLVFGGLAAWFGTEAGAESSVPSAQNQALSNPAETSQVATQVSSAIAALFSYNYANPDATSTAVGEYLTGAAVKQYATLFATLRTDGPKEKLVVTTTVSNIGVELLTPDTARVLVFATENEGSAGDTTPESLGAMLAVNAAYTGGTWKIEGIDTFAS
jgi:Mce-associated membrane protein